MKVLSEIEQKELNDRKKNYPHNGTKIVLDKFGGWKLFVRKWYYNEKKEKEDYKQHLIFQSPVKDNTLKTQKLWNEMSDDAKAISDTYITDLATQYDLLPYPNRIVKFKESNCDDSIFVINGEQQYIDLCAKLFTRISLETITKEEYIVKIDEVKSDRKCINHLINEVKNITLNDEYSKKQMLS